MTSLEQRFTASVKVVRGLPKSGHFKPSDDLRLRFYAYYKQATEGPNTANKPPFYDFVAKYKWNAWKGLEQMSAEDAMKGYIQTFVEVLENMIVTETDENIFELLAPFKEYLPEKSQLMLTKHQF